MLFQGQVQPPRSFFPVAEGPECQRPVRGEGQLSTGALGFGRRRLKISTGALGFGRQRSTGACGSIPSAMARPSHPGPAVSGRTPHPHDGLCHEPHGLVHGPALCRPVPLWMRRSTTQTCIAGCRRSTSRWRTCGSSRSGSPTQATSRGRGGRGRGDGAAAMAMAMAPTVKLVASVTARRTDLNLI